MTDHMVFTSEMKEIFPELPALAERLGVKPAEKAEGLQMLMKDGRRYNVFEIINALLDRMDTANAVLDQRGTTK
jgi:hypothetical protein